VSGVRYFSSPVAALGPDARSCQRDNADDV
jgi:hypothetical protein